MITFSIIQKSQLEGALRIDAEYYQPEYLEMNKKLIKHNSISLDSYTEYLTDGAHKTPDYQEAGILFLSSGLIYENYINFSDAKFISEKEDRALSHCKPRINDVLISKSGKIGVATVFDEDINCNLFEGVALLRLKNIDPFFMSVFLNSYFGQKQIQRLVIGISQPHLHLEQIRRIKVPSISSINQNEIKRILQSSQETIEKSEGLYKQAEELLLKELGLKDVFFKNDLSYVVNFSDLKSVNRIDSEYFQPKYQKLIEEIKSQNAKTLGELVSMRKGVEPGSEAYQEVGKLFIRVSSVAKLGIEEKDQKYLSEELYQELKKNYEPKLGDILLTKDATPGIAYVIKEPLEGIISGGILDLKIKDDIESEYLALCISSIVGQWQAQRDAGGSIISHWKPEQIRNLIIPILPKSSQQKIADLVRKSHEARKKSKELLEQAKREVEEMIENNNNN